MSSDKKVKMVSTKGNSRGSRKAASVVKSEKIKSKGVEDSSQESSNNTSISLLKFNTIMLTLFEAKNIQISALSGSLAENFTAANFIINNCEKEQTEDIKTIVNTYFDTINNSDIIAGTVGAAFCGGKMKSNCFLPSGCTAYGAGSINQNKEDTGHEDCEDNVFLVRKIDGVEVLILQFRSQSSNSAIIHLMDDIVETSPKIRDSIIKYNINKIKVYVVTEGINSSCKPITKDEFRPISENVRGIKKDWSSDSENSNNTRNSDTNIDDKRESDWSWFSIITILLVILIIGFLIYYVMYGSYGSMVDIDHQDSGSGGSDGSKSSKYKKVSKHGH
jgi:hypothetical protein